MSAFWLGYLGLGMAAGFVAGLFGVGGGLFLVPLLHVLLVFEGVAAEQVLHVALGTAMAAIVFSSVASLRAHHRHGAVRWDVFRNMAPGLLAGTFGGSLFAASVPARPLALTFSCFVYFASVQMLLDLKPRPGRALPGRPGLIAVGALIGAASSLVAAGGGFLSVPFMVACNVAIHQAVGTSAALGLPIAAAGAIGYMVAGQGVPGIPGMSVGYVYLPALVGVVSMSMLTAPMGARLAHKLPVKPLKRAFGVLLAVLASRMLYKVLLS